MLGPYLMCRNGRSAQVRGLNRANSDLDKFALTDAREVASGMAPHF